MYNKKIIFIVTLLILILAFSINADWKQFGNDDAKSFTSTNALDIVNGNQTKTLLNENNNSLFDIISGDLDGNGLNEIYTYNNSQIVLHNGSYNTLTSYFNSDLNLTARGSFAIADFIAGGNDELIIFTTKADTSNSLFIMNYNGTDLILTKEITNLIENSGGITCGDYDNETDIDCIYPAVDNFIYRYDSDDTSINTPVTDYNGVCNINNTGDKSNTMFMFDVDLNGYMDFFMTEYTHVTGYCGQLNQYEYDPIGNNFSFTLSHSTTGYPISALTMVDLPNTAQNGVVFASSIMCSGIGGTPCCWTDPISEIRVGNVVTGATPCGYTFAQYNGGETWLNGGINCGASNTACTPHIASLHTCWDNDGGNCDLYGGSDNIFAVAVGDDTLCTNFGTYVEMFVFNVSTGFSDCELVDNFPMGNTTPANCEAGANGRSGNPYQMPKAIWGDFDGDSELEVMFNEVYEKDGTQRGKIDTDSAITSISCDDTYFSISELTGDTSSEIIIKNIQDSDRGINIYSYGDFGGEPIAPIEPIYPTLVCDLPVLFCDDFNYNQPLNDNDWLVYKLDGSINQTFSPINNALNLQGSGGVSPFHEIFYFPVEYILDSSSTLVEDIYSPVWTSQFSLLINNENNTDEDSCLRYDADGFHNSGWSFLFCQNGSIMTKQSNLLYKETCTNCFTLNESNDIKIISYFGQRPTFNFNSSVTDDLKLFVNGVQVDDDNISYIDINVDHLVFYNFIKDNTANAIIDDYYVYTGTDTNIDTTANYYRDLYRTDITNATDLGLGIENKDLYSGVLAFWYNMGLKSKASRYMGGLILLFLVGLAVYGTSASMGIQPNPLSIGGIMLLFMILEVFLQLLPAWIPIILGILGAGAGALLWKFAGTG